MGTLAWLYRRRIGFVALRGQARLKLNGLRFAGADGTMSARAAGTDHATASGARLAPQGQRQPR